MAYSISWTSKTETSIEVQVYYDQSPDMDYFYLTLDGNSYDTVENDNDQYYNGYHTFTGLSSGTSYTLGVTFVDMNLDTIGSDSTTTSTYESNSSPYTPSNLSPSDGSTTTDNTPTFYADVSDPDGDSVSLELEVSEYSDFSSIYEYASGSYYSSGSRASVTSSSLYNGTWYWRLQAYDGSDYSSYTSGRKLIIERENSAPNTPTNLSPSDGVTIKENNVDISADVSDPDGDKVKLIVEVDTDSTFPSPDTYSTSYYASGSRVTQNVGTYSDGTYYWRAKAQEDWEYLQSSYTATRSFTISLRPSDWSWSSTYTKGDPFNITATEWNNFTERINEFRDYKGFSFYSFSALAGAGKNANASHFNEAIDAIDDMNPPTLPPSTVVGVSDVVNPSDADDIITDDFDLIRDSLNSIQ